MTFARGQTSKLSDLTTSEDLVVGMGVEAPDSPVFDISCFGLDAANKLSDDRYFVFYNQTQSPDGEIRQLGPVGGDSEAFGVDLSRGPLSSRCPWLPRRYPPSPRCRPGRFLPRRKPRRASTRC